MNATELATLASRLQANPTDIRTWLELSSSLSDSGEPERAAASFVSLGDAANRSGHVALAVACARWLDQSGAGAKARALVDAIATTHCKGSPSIDAASRPKPPPPPAVAAARPTKPPPIPDERATLADARARVDTAIAAAVAAAAAAFPATLPPTRLIRGLDAGDVRELIAVMKLSRCREGATVVEVDDPARSLYWIAVGSAEASRDGHSLGTLGDGAFFGEIALVGGTTRTATVTCTESCWLLEIPSASVEAAAAKAPHMAQVLARYARKRLLANVMRTSELFSRLSDHERTELLPRFTTQLVAKSARVIAKGGANSSLYVVVSGTLEVRSGDEVVAELTAGDGVGEASLLSRKAPAWDVVATTPAVLLCLSREDFDDIAVKHPALLAEVYKLLVEREQLNENALIHDAADLIV